MAKSEAEKAADRIVAKNAKASGGVKVGKSESTDKNGSVWSFLKSSQAGGDDK